MCPHLSPFSDFLPLILFKLKTHSVFINRSSGISFILIFLIHHESDGRREWISQQFIISQTDNFHKIYTETIYFHLVLLFYFKYPIQLSKELHGTLYYPKTVNIIHNLSFIPLSLYQVMNRWKDARSRVDYIFDYLSAFPHEQSIK